MRDLFSPAVIKFGCARALVRGQILCVLKRAAIREKIGDTCGAKGVIANGRMNARGGSAAADHAPSIRLIQGLVGQCIAIVPAGRAEQKALAVLGDARLLDIRMQRFGKRMMTRHYVKLAAFLMKPDGPACATGRRSSTFIFRAAVTRAKL